MAKFTKTQYILLAIAIALIGSVSFNIIIQIEKKLEAKYQEGLTKGQEQGINQIGNFITQQLKTNGFLKIQVGEDENKNPQYIILRPQTQ